MPPPVPRPLRARRTVLIADSPADVDSARNGVAVATGGNSISDLRDASAALVLPALTDTAAVVSGVRTVAGIP